MNSKTLFYQVCQNISGSDREEAKSVAYLIFEHLFSLTKTQIIAEKEVSIDEPDEKKLTEIISRVNKNEPVQYILGVQEFYGRKFQVNPSVLIPRPETEELIRIILDYAAGKRKSLEILDIGTGSGCIPITVKLEIVNSKVYGIDISELALDTAKKNSRQLNADVMFQRLDILSENLPFNDLDIIVSNPPYIAQAEMETMHPNVVQYEPHLALFVPDKDPLKFYKAILMQAKKALASDGLLAVEINEAYGKPVKDLFLQNRYDAVEIVKDIAGKDRVVKGIFNSKQL